MTKACCTIDNRDVTVSIIYGCTQVGPAHAAGHVIDNIPMVYYLWSCGDGMENFLLINYS